MSERQWIKATIAALHTATIVLVIMGALLALAVMIENAHGHDLPIHKCVPGIVEGPGLDEYVDLGLGQHVDDIYTRIPTDDKLIVRLRNACIDRKDPANTLHELTHLYNKLLSNVVSAKTGQDGVVFYLLFQKGTAFAHPKVTLAQIAQFVKKEDQGNVYQSYLVEARPWYNNQPLFFLDEAVAIGHGMLSTLEAGSRDPWRAGQCLEAAICTSALIEAVQAFDPKYPDLERLREFCNWHNQRLAHLYNHNYVNYDH